MSETPHTPTKPTKSTKIIKSEDIIAENEGHIQLISPELSEKLNAKILEQNHKPGLYIVATPIGNIFDISLRALWILKKACCIFAEDTRQSRKLLDWYEIKTKVVACHEYNETDSSVISRINQINQINQDNGGIFALISDAGTPAISDPGYRLVNWCLENGVDVFPIPGASAAIAAMSASGMPSDRFTFFGFPPPKEKARKDFFENIRGEQGTLIFYESPNRLVSCLKDMLEIFGDRSCCVCREITKVFEEFKRRTLAESVRYFQEQKHKPTGEFVILLDGYSKKSEEINFEIIKEELKGMLQNEGIKMKDAVKILADKYAQKGIRRNKIYKIGIEIQEGL